MTGGARWDRGNYDGGMVELDRGCFITGDSLFLGTLVRVLSFIRVLTEDAEFRNPHN